MANFEEYKNIWVFAEQRQGKLMNVALELVGEGHKLSREISAETKVCAVLVGDKVDHLADELFAYGADSVYLLEDELLSTQQTAIPKSSPTRSTSTNRRSSYSARPISEETWRRESQQD